MKREELRNKLTDILSVAMSGGINLTQAERSIWDLFNSDLPPAEGAEKLKQALCDDIRESLNRASLDKIFDSEQNSLPLVDYLSAAIPGDTIASGKEEIENIVEQIYFDMEEWKSLALFQPQPTAEGAEETTAMEFVKREGLYSTLLVGSRTNPIYLEDLLTRFATLHAQQMAEKMVEERLRKELIAYVKWYGSFSYENLTDEMLVDEYLKADSNGKDTND